MKESEVQILPLTSNVRKRVPRISISIIDMERKTLWMFLLSLMIPLSMTIGPIWTRIYFWDFSLIFMYTLWIGRLSQSEQWRFDLNTMDAFIILLLVWLCLCNVLSLRPAISFERWLLWVRGFLVYLYFSKNLGRVIKPGSILMMLMLLVFLESGLAIFQMITQSNFGQINQYFGVFNPDKIPGFLFEGKKIIRAPGTFYNTGILGGWMVLLSPVFLSAYFFQKGTKRKLAFILIFLMGLAGTLCTLSRSLIAAILMSIVIVIYWYGFNKLSGVIKTKALNLNSVVIMLIVILVGICFAASFGGSLDKGVHRISTDFDSHLERRIAYMNSATQIMAIKPVFGVGQGNFSTLLEKTGFQFYHHGEGVVHNIPLLIGAESGIPGFLLFSIILLFLIIKLLRKIHSKPSNSFGTIRGGILIGIIGYIACMQWTAGLIHHSMLPIFFVCLGLCSAKQPHKLL